MSEARGWVYRRRPHRRHRAGPAATAFERTSRSRIGQARRRGKTLDGLRAGPGADLDRGASAARYIVALGGLDENLKDPYAEKVARRDYDGALLLVNRPVRLWLLRDWWQSGVITTDDLRASLPDWWSDAEPRSTLAWWPLFRAVGYCGAPLPPGDPLTIYRGGSPGGIAWTLDRQKAEWFAVRFRFDGSTGEVLTGEVDRAKVRAYITDRNESEVIVHPRSVRIVAREVVTRPVLT